jgi:hypothetical protein
MSWLKKLFGKHNAIQSEHPSEEPLTFPFELIKVSGEDALSTLLQLRNSQERTPVVLGDKEDLIQIRECIEYDDEDPSKIISKGLSINIQEWLDTQIEEDPNYYHFEFSGVDIEEPPPTAPLTLASKILTGEPKSEVFIALIPTKNAWEVPATIEFSVENPPETPELAMLLARE